jgi:peptidoglycan/xylan/chitin deacetylase (PgdA/CDA1 family)
MAYQVKTPWWLSNLLYSKLIWKMPGNENAVYLTFDDGPHPVATAFVLEQLKKYNARATFFCIGKNAEAYPHLHDEIIAAGHTVGNHTHNHLNGWNSKTTPYLKNIIKASDHVKSHLFRPPYGRIKRSQANRLLNAHRSWRIYMWDVLSGDFDIKISPERCLNNVLSNIESGSIIVFHDSEKAWERMSYALPHVLQYCKEKNWELKALPKT